LAAANPYREEVFWSASSAPATEDENPYASPAVLPEPARRPGLVVTTKSLARPADRGDRFFAMLLDSLFQVVLVISVALTTFAIFGSDDGRDDSKALIFTFLTYGSMFVLHLVQCFYIVTRGQSFGKMIMGIRLANHRNDAIPDFARSVVVRIWLINLIIAFVPLFGLVDALFIFGRESRCLHDMMAGTRVITLGARARKRR